MDNRFNQKEQRSLLEALERAKEYERKLLEKREQKLWAETDIPAALFDILSKFSKADLDKIRQNLDLQNLSALKKADLVNKLVSLIPANFKDTICKLDQGRYDLLKAIIKNDGFIPVDIVSKPSLQTLMEYGLVFPGLFNNQKILFMPAELIEVFISLDGYELKKSVRRNTDWINLTYGLLYYYGVIDSWRANNIIAKLTGEQIDFLEYMKVMSFASGFYRQAKHTGYGYQDYRVPDPKKVIDEQKKRPDVDYYPFTKQQLLKASLPEYVERTPAAKKLTDFLTEYYDFSDEENEKMLRGLTLIINTESNPKVIFDYMESRLELPSLEVAQELADKLMDLNNNTRMWRLKGYTPHELFQREKKHLKPLPAVPFRLGQEDRLDQKDTNIFDIKTGSKIGRNDPCPCGSGKKYKKCCGK